MMLKVLFGHDPETFWLKKSFGIVPEKGTFGIMPKAIFKNKILKNTLGMIPKVLFGHDPETFWLKKCFWIVPEKNFRDLALSNF